MEILIHIPVHITRNQSCHMRSKSNNITVNTGLGYSITCVYSLLTTYSTYPVLASAAEPLILSFNVSVC